MNEHNYVVNNSSPTRKQKSIETVAIHVIVCVICGEFHTYLPGYRKRHCKKKGCNAKLIYADKK